MDTRLLSPRSPTEDDEESTLASSDRASVPAVPLTARTATTMTTTGRSEEDDGSAAPANDVDGTPEE